MTAVEPDTVTSDPVTSDSVTSDSVTSDPVTSAESAAAEPMFPGGAETGVSRVVVEVDGIPMSAFVSMVPRPRAVVLALHGGAAMSAYFDNPDRPRSSLLRIGATLGFTVIALDRPGYGSSSAYAAELESHDRRAELVYAAADKLLGSGSRGAGVFLLGHSAGCPLAIRMAAGPRGAELLGVEIAGSGLRHHEYMLGFIDDRWRDASAPAKPRRGLYDLLWKPPNLYPSDVVGGARFVSATPGYEGTVGQDWPAEFPKLAAQVRVPVHYSLGEHERVWQTGPEAMAEVAGLFTASPRVEVLELAGSGHNLSVGLTAAAYHLKILSFVEECAVARLAARRGGTDRPPSQEDR